ncbi:MAG: hypothetical protein ACRDTQ_20455, partial [Micromonosporaceae bacterium]
MTGPQQPPYGGQGGQWSGGGEWQPPSEHTQYGPPPEGGPGSYDQPQAYEQPQSYEQPGYAQPGYSDQYSAPPSYSEPYSGPPGYDPNAGPPPMPAPVPSQSNPVPWIIGGVGGLVVLVLLVVVAFVVLSGGSSDDTGGPGGGATTGGGSTEAAPEGGYSLDNVSNACDLVDPAGIEEWAGDQTKDPENKEDKGSDYYAYVSCSAEFEDDSSEYGNTTSFTLTASTSETSETAKDTYEDREKSAKGKTGSGRESGDVTGVGEDGYFASEVTEYSTFNSVTYEMSVVDSNLVLECRIYSYLKPGDTDTEPIK